MSIYKTCLEIKILCNAIVLLFKVIHSVMIFFLTIKLTLIHFILMTVDPQLHTKYHSINIK